MEKRYYAKFHAVFATIRQMLEMLSASKREIGFHAKAALPRRAK